MEEKYKKIIRWIVFGTGIVVVIGILLFSSFAKIKRQGTEYYENQMIDIADSHVKKIDTELEKLQISGKTAAYMLSLAENPKNEEIISAISAVLNNTDAYRVIYHAGDGAGYEWNGKEITKVDLTTYSYYRLICKVKGIKYTYVEDEKSGEDALMIIIPIGESTDSSLLIFYSMDKVNNMLRVATEFDSHSFAVLVDSNGTIITKSNYESSFLLSNSLWNGISQEFCNDVTRAKVQLMNEVSGCFEADSEDAKESKVLVYSPVKTNDWAVIIGVDREYVNKREKDYWKNSVSMAYQILGVIFFFFLIFLIYNYIGKKKNDENDRILREKAETDLLTGLTNKLATERKIKEYIAQNPNSLAMMFVLDIDNFKKINDTMGHAFGDEVLKTLGRTLSPIFRVSDIVGRTGGDEFTIFLKFLNSDENTLKEAEKLVQFFKDFTAGEYVKYSATASIGAAVFPADGKDFDSLYKAADKALYKAKQRGKNQLAFYDDRDRVNKDEVIGKEQS
ncbi:MAG: diguanylate cyclase domain-containing protein [Suilimivivens sp.]